MNLQNEEKLTDVSGLKLQSDGWHGAGSGWDLYAEQFCQLNKNLIDRLDSSTEASRRRDCSDRPKSSSEKSRKARLPGNSKLHVALFLPIIGRN